MIMSYIDPYVVFRSVSGVSWLLRLGHRAGPQPAPDREAAAGRVQWNQAMDEDGPVMSVS